MLQEFGKNRKNKQNNETDKTIRIFKNQDKKRLKTKISVYLSFPSSKKKKGLTFSSIENTFNNYRNLRKHFTADRKNQLKDLDGFFSQRNAFNLFLNKKNTYVKAKRPFFLKQYTTSTSLRK